MPCIFIKLHSRCYCLKKLILPLVNTTFQNGKNLGQMLWNFWGAELTPYFLKSKYLPCQNL